MVGGNFDTGVDGRSYPRVDCAELSKVVTELVAPESTPTFKTYPRYVRILSDVFTKSKQLQFVWITTTVTVSLLAG